MLIRAHRVPFPLVHNRHLECIPALLRVHLGVARVATGCVDQYLLKVIVLLARAVARGFLGQSALPELDADIDVAGVRVFATVVEPAGIGWSDSSQTKVKTTCSSGTTSMISPPDQMSAVDLNLVVATRSWVERDLGPAPRSLQLGDSQ